VIDKCTEEKNRTSVSFFLPEKPTTLPM